MSAGGRGSEDGIAQARDEDTGQLLLSQQGALSSRQQHLRPVYQYWMISELADRTFVLDSMAGSNNSKQADR